MKLLHILILVPLFFTSDLATIAKDSDCPIPSKYDRHLVEPFYFEFNNNIHKDRPYRPGCIRYVFGDVEEARHSAFKAENLAAAGKLKQAENEITKALILLGNHEPDSFREEWLLLRAKIRILRRKADDAICDIKTSIAVRNRYRPILMARLLIDAGEFELAEKILLPYTRSDTTLKAHLYAYYLGLAREHTDKKKSLKMLMKAATLFMERGETESAEYCLERINNLGSGQYSLKDLKPRRDGVDKFKRVVKELATNPKCFEYSEVNSSFGKSIFFPQVNGAKTIIAYDKCFQGARIENFLSGEKRLSVWFSPYACGLTKADCADILKDLPRVPFRDLLNPEILFTDTYKVPSGFLAMSYRKGGFQNVYSIQLFSTDGPLERRRSLEGESGSAESKELSTEFEKGENMQ